ncbi:MAG: hypothetical protein ACMUHB_04765 [Thermoplasmatota archaeon]
MKKRSSNKGPKFVVPAGAVYALLAAIFLICITVVSVALADGGDESSRERAPPPEIRMPHLFIEEVFFRSFETEGITVEITIYLTNDGTKDAIDVRAHLWPVVDESNIATDMQEVDFGNLRVNETGMKEVQIGLKAGTIHSVEILVFENSRLILKGRAEVSTQGQGGGQYQNVEVRGTHDDSDYDGMPDEWERYYGLNPGDPEDALLDRDGDGVTNLMEYRLNRDPTMTPSDDDVDDDSDDGPIGFPESEEGASIAIGAVLFLLLIVGVIVILIITAAYSSHKARKRADEKAWKGAEQKGTRKAREFEHIIKEGARDSTDTLDFGDDEDKDH